MKKIYSLAIVSALAMVASIGVSAQHIGDMRFGVFGGFTSSKAQGINDLKSFDTKNVAAYQAGVTAQFPIAGGFEIQPSIQWSMKGTRLDEVVAGQTLDLKANVGYLEGAVQLQWGPDLLLFRPYLLAEPFVGYALTVDEVLDSAGSKEQIKEFASSSLKRLEYGAGVGFGVEFWQLQLAFKWFWNFGSLYDGNNYVSTSDVSNQVKSALENGKNFSGFMVSLSLFLF